MKRSGFKRPQIERQPVVVVPIPAEMRARINFGPSANEAAAAFKVKPVRHEGYRRLVAGLPCLMCGIEGRTQVCHTDLGKGMATKTDDRTVWPGCADQPGKEGCHTNVGRNIPREKRREFEAWAAERTRTTIRAMGLWPADLAPWPGDEPTTKG